MRLVPLQNGRRLGLLLLASSHVMHTFQVRPFSNSIEAVLVALSLLLLRKIISDSMLKKVSCTSRGISLSYIHWQSSLLHLMAVTFVTGVFTRPTFLIFGAPIAYQVALRTFTNAGTITRWLQRVVPPLFTATAACTAFIMADTLYFRDTVHDIVVTPFNFLKYNFSPHNLADHGLHPHWLHCFVNLPMLIGPWVLWLVVRSILNRSKSLNENNKSSEVDVLCRSKSLDGWRLQPLNCSSQQSYKSSLCH
jgi:phosphatidylinositol glycan class Z